MPVGAKPVDPRVTFNFSIEIEGLEVALAQSVNIPTLSVGKVEHNQAGVAHSTKTAGKLLFEDITLEKVMPADTADTWAWDWLRQVRDSVTGATQGATVYKKQITIIHYGNGTDILDRWEIEGAFPIQVEYSRNDATQEAESIIETLTLSVDRYTRA